jgi:hypothetical protein
MVVGLVVAVAISVSQSLARAANPGGACADRPPPITRLTARDVGAAEVGARGPLASAGAGAPGAWAPDAAGILVTFKRESKTRTGWVRRPAGRRRPVKAGLATATASAAQLTVALTHERPQRRASSARPRSTTGPLRRQTCTAPAGRATAPPPRARRRQAARRACLCPWPRQQPLPLPHLPQGGRTQGGALPGDGVSEFVDLMIPGQPSGGCRAGEAAVNLVTGLGAWRSRLRWPLLAGTCR